MNTAATHATHAPSRMSRQKGFSLIELMVVVAIIGILGMIALPQYQTFSAKAKLAAGFAEVATGKVGIEALMAEGGQVASATAESLGMPAKGSRCETFDVSMDSAGVGSLVCNLKEDGFYGKDQTVSLSRDVDGIWTCSGSVSDKNLLPDGCRA